MHELGLVYQIVRTVDEVKQEQSLVDIDSIILQVGEMTDVVPRFIEEAWKAVAPTTQFPDAKMVVEVMPAMARCKSCGFEGSVRSISFECPRCNSLDFTITSGREFLIKEIVAK